MKKLIAVCVILGAFPASAQEALSPLQQYLYNESGYAPPQLAPAPAPAPETVAVVSPYAYPAYQPDYNSAGAYYEEGADDAASEVADEGASLRGLLNSAGN